MKKFVFTILFFLSTYYVYSQNYSILHSFESGNTGDSQIGNLIFDGTYLYGLNPFGGTSNLGYVYKIQPNGAGFTVLHNFTGTSNDGSQPNGSLVLSGTTLYGMTLLGGLGGGVIFRINTDGSNFAILHKFNSISYDGSNPHGSLILINSALFGMTYTGGSSNVGTIFRINTDSSNYSIIYNFQSSDGANPFGSLLSNADYLYGMTQLGGSSGFGVLFKVDTTGSNFSLLHTFAVTTTNGAMPFGCLAINGSILYGMTPNGGTNNKGTIFKINTNGSNFSILHSFSTSLNDGTQPVSSFILGGSVLFGTTWLGGSYNKGTIFKINTDGSNFSLLHSFEGNPCDGANSWCSLLFLDSILYATTVHGGNTNFGTIFALNISTPTSTDTTITLTNLSPSSVCPGSNVNVSYSIVGIFDICNNYIVQLSDASGSFSNPLNLATTTGNTTGIIPITIPDNASPGTNYRIRIISSNPVDTSINSLQLTVYSKPAVFNVTGGGAYCVGDSGLIIGLSGSETGVIYQLFLNNSAIGITVSGTGSSINYGYRKQAGNYSVRAINLTTGCIKFMSDTASIIINQLPGKFHLLSSGSLCEGDNGLPVALTGSETGVYYQLLNNGINIGDTVSGTGDTLKFGLHNQNGLYYVRATSKATGCSSLSDSITITVNPKPVPNIIYNTPLTFCEGDSVILTSSLALSNYDLTWSTGQKIQRIIVKTSGKYILTAKDKKTGCGDTVSVQVIVNKNPTAQITVIGNKTMCYQDSAILQANFVTGNQYLWSTGETSPQIIVKIAGKYKLTVTNQNNCSSSDSVTINVIQQINLTSNKLSIDFGDLDPCASQKIDSVIITNNGSQTASIANVESDNDAFTVISPLPPFTIINARNIKLKIKFSKSAVGSYSGNIKLISVCGDTFSISVSGNRTQSSVSSAENIVNFGTNCIENSVKIDTVITIYNDGSADAVFQTPIIQHPFSIESPTFPQTIKANDSLKVTIRYSPLVEGIYDSLVTFPYRIGTCPDNTMDVSLVAKYLNIQLNTKDTLFSFTPFCQCDISKDTSFYVKNIGNYKLTLTGIQTDNNSDNLTQGLPITLNTNDSVKINLRFKPQGNDSITSKVIIKYEDCGKEQEIILAGRRIGTGFNPSDTINFGEFIKCRDSVLTQILHISNTNCSGNIARITGVSISSDAFSTNILPNDTLPDNGVNNYSITYSPKSTNDTIAVLTIDYEPCSLTKSIILKGIISNSELTSANINFGNVEGGLSKAKSLTIKNIGNTRLTIDSISAIISPFSIEPPHPQFPLDINAGDSLVLSIKYSPSGEETDSLNVIVYSSKPCSIRTNPELYGTGSVSHFTAKTVVYIMADSAAAGESINLPLMLGSSENLIKSGINSFIARISLNKTILKPINNTPNGTLNSNDTRQIEITGNWKQGVWQDTVGKLADIEFVAALGDVECSPLVIDTIIWIGGASNVTKNDGEFCLTGLCKEGGTARLVNTDYTLKLHQSKPNPAREIIEIDFEVIEQGRTKLFIINAIGDIVATIYDGYLSPGQYTLNYNLTTYPDGVYMYVLQTPSDILCKKLELIK